MTLEVDELEALLEAPCKWCGYSGANYWQHGSHPKKCPWHEIGGGDMRRLLLEVDNCFPDDDVPSYALHRLKRPNSPHPSET